MPDYDSRRYALLNRWDSSHLEKIEQMLDLDATCKVLEVGSGRGHLTTRLAQLGVDVIGVDANPNAPDVADTDRVIHMKGESLDFGDEMFDVVISVHTLEHIQAIEKAVAEMARVLKPGGRSMHIYPAEPIMGLYAIPTSVILYGTPFKARKVHCHKLWPAKLRRMMKPHGLTEIHHEFNLLKTPQFVSVFEKAR